MLKMNRDYEKKLTEIELSNECDLGASLVDLPHVQLFVIIDAFVHLIGFESFRCATIHNFGDFYRCARLSDRFFDQIVDFIG